jgi:hypothetical protein
MKMKKIRFRVLSAIVVTLLSLSGPAWAGRACAALTEAYTSVASGKMDGLQGTKKFKEILLACRSHVNAESASPNAQAAVKGGSFTIFDVPGADPSSGPSPAAINNAGMIVGTYVDPAYTTHSFLRAPDGTVTPFDPPGAVCDAAVSNECSTASGINAAGIITGEYVDASAHTHGYLRTPDGQFRTFDVPGSDNATSPMAINAAGTVTGMYRDTAGLTRGFLRQANGIITAFDPPGSVYTSPGDINSPGAIGGIYADSEHSYGFVRSRDGNIVPFSAPGGGFMENYPHVTLNAAGAIAATFCSEPACDAVHGLLRSPDGTLTTIDAPGDNQLTQPSGIDASGEITGWYLPSDFSALHGFFRTRQGKFITIDPPGAGVTTPFAINDSGMVTGNYCDAALTSCHGFIWTQHP